MKNTNDALVKQSIDMFVRSTGAEMGPPLGTVLGNLGVNSSKFCKDFNDFTKQLPSYFLLKVRIMVFENRSYSFFVKAPSTSFILKLLKSDKSVKQKHFDRMHKRTVPSLIFKDLLILSNFKSFVTTHSKALPTVWSTANTAAYFVVLS